MTAVEVCIDGIYQGLGAGSTGRTVPAQRPNAISGFGSVLGLSKRIPLLCLGRGSRWSLDPQAPWRRAHIPNIAVKAKGLRRSKVVVSNLRPNLRARCHEASNSGGVGRRAIAAYLSRYFALPGSQKLSG